MFEVGQVYIVGFVSYDSDGNLDVIHHHHCEAIEVAMPVVKFRQGQKEFVVNTSAPTFAGADLPD